MSRISASIAVIAANVLTALAASCRASILKISASAMILFSVSVKLFMSVSGFCGSGDVSIVAKLAGARGRVVKASFRQSDCR